MAENACEETFRRRLFEKFEKNPNYLLPKTKYQEIIDQLKATLGVARKTPRQYKLLARSVFVVVNWFWCFQFENTLVKVE